MIEDDNIIDQPAEGESNDSKPESIGIDILQENAELKKSLQEKTNQYLMALAESENSRKRMQKERQELTKYAVESVLADFITPLEGFEKALGFAENMSDEIKQWALGFGMILGQFKQILNDHGITEYSALGQMFDPHLHEAVETQETNEHPEGTVLQEFSKGYKVGKRSIKPARVQVAKPSASQEDE
ncbi:nucleotide exchange factor GrpE [Candidatus Clavichlamydia salmonicola]|uniref:nucleotide exchange factor GrpE n=1 Tax=Candidatus Clavichlamydia salmonicola TaxID=469812 RepID=UPI0018915F4B|nr:nucleotide exchange factor GrpE [Candidatus Clavichlamydia salmonicola]